MPSAVRHSFFVTTLAWSLVVLRLADLDADDDAVARCLGPEIDALDALDLLLQLDPFGDDVAVAEPGRFLVDVVVAAVLRALLHRPGAGDGGRRLAAVSGQKYGLATFSPMR